MRQSTKRLLPVRSGFDGQERDIVDHTPRGRIDARFLASLISNHLNFDFMRKNRRIEPVNGASAYSAANGRVKPANSSALDILA